MRPTIYIACSGIGHIRRGFENYCEELFHLISKEQLSEVFLIKGAGQSERNEIVLQSLKRNSTAAKILSLVTGKNPYSIQGVTFGMACMRYFLEKNNFVVYLGEPVLYAVLNRFRQRTKKNFRIIFFTGGQTIPANFDERDFLHHVTDQLLSESRVTTLNQFFLPHFISERLYATASVTLEKLSCRKELDIPANRKVLISVGALDNSVKRMGYVINEVSKLDASEYFLIILGERESETDEVINFAKQKLPERNYIITTVARDDISKYYTAADMFLLASLKEGFGLVYLEALWHGLPVVAHDFPESRFVLNAFGVFLDMSRESSLSHFVRNYDFTQDHLLRAERKKYVNENFSWGVIKDQYLQMFGVAMGETGLNNLPGTR